MKDHRIAKLVAVLLAAWLVVAIFSTEVVHAQGSKSKSERKPESVKQDKTGNEGVSNGGNSIMGNNFNKPQELNYRFSQVGENFRKVYSLSQKDMKSNGYSMTSSHFKVGSPTIVKTVGHKITLKSRPEIDEETD